MSLSPATRTEAVNIRVTPAIRDRLREVAERFGLSQTELINRLVVAGLPAYEARP